MPIPASVSLSSPLLPSTHRERTNQRQTFIQIKKKPDDLLLDRTFIEVTMAVVDNTDASDIGIDVAGSTSKNTVPNAVKDLSIRLHQGTAKAMENSNGGIEEKKNRNAEEVKKEVEQLRELLSKLNPMAEEFVPPSLIANGNVNGNVGFVMQNGLGNGGIGGIGGRRKRNGYGQGKRRVNSRTSTAQREEVIRRTIYVSDIDQQVTEEELATLFINCGQVVDCRVCGDPNSVLRFAFIEFTDEESARAALNLSGTMLGFYPVKVLPSKTAIAPVDPKFLPRSEDEREMCSRTIYCTNIDKKVTHADVRLFFESICGPIYRLRLLGDCHHSTRIAFVEFVRAESAIAALNCSGAVLGSLALRVSPSKTPVRPRAPRPPMHVSGGGSC